MQTLATIIDIQPEVSKQIDVDLLPVKYNITDQAINQLRSKYESLEITDKDSYREVVTAISDVRKRRTSVETRRKELKAKSLDYGRRVDAEAKRITMLLEEIEEPLKEKRIAEDLRESKRLSLLHGMIEAISEMVPTVPTSSNDLSVIIFDLTTMTIGLDFQEFADQAEAVRVKSLDRINKLLADRLQWEAEEKARQEEIAKLEMIKADNAIIEAERKARESEEEKARKAEREAIEAEKRALVAERAKIEAEKREKREREEREATEKREAVERTAKQRNSMLALVGRECPLPDAGVISEEEFLSAYNEYRAAWDAKQEAARVETEEKTYREKAEFERIATENAVREAREKQEREERERKEKAEAEETDRVEREALRPDKEKLLAFAEYLDRILIFPDTTSDKVRYIMFEFVSMSDNISNYIRTEASKL